MKELELKHLAGYLPYGLKIMVHDDFEMEMSHKRIQDNFEDDLKYISIDGVLEDFHCKPILRPLSNLTKEIEVNGEKFVPIDWFEIGDDQNDSEEYNYGNVKLIKTLKCISIFNISNDVRYLPFDVVQKLLEWHFDIYGLIENNLAIDINTL